MHGSSDVQMHRGGGKRAVPLGTPSEVDRLAHLVFAGMSALPAPARIVGPDKLVLWSNPAMAELNGGADGPCSRLHTLLCDTPECPLARAARGEDRLQQEVTVRPEGAAAKRCLLSTAALRDSDGRLRGVLHVYQSPVDLPTDQQVDTVERQLRERGKELNCVFEITRLVEDAGDDLEAILQGIAKLLAQTWQFPDAAEAEIVLDERPYRSPGYRPSPWRMSSEIIVAGEPAGRIVVVYNQPCPEADEGPFLAEERRLLDAVAERLGKIVERLRTRQQLAAERQALHESNVALRSVLARVEDGKREVADALQANVDKIIAPLLASLEAELPSSQRRYVELIRQNLQDIASPFADSLSKQFMALTPAELRICDMIRQGMSSKEIAGLLHISPSTVSRHREHIRNKLGLTHRGVNLATYLNSFMKGRSR